MLSVIGSLVLTVAYGCTTLYHGDPSTDHDKLPTLLWGGVDLPLWTVYAGIALWSVGAVGFIRPVRYGLQILLVGGTVLMLLRHFGILSSYPRCARIACSCPSFGLDHAGTAHPRMVPEEGHSKSENAIEKQAELGEGLLLVQNDIEHKGIELQWWRTTTSILIGFRSILVLRWSK